MLTICLSISLIFTQFSHVVGLISYFIDWKLYVLGKFRKGIFAERPLLVINTIEQHVTEKKTHENQIIVGGGGGGSSN